MADPIHSMNAEDDGTVIGYMCTTDWECELGAAQGGNTIFASMEDALETLNCARGCGIVEVRVRFSKEVLTGTDRN